MFILLAEVPYEGIIDFSHHPTLWEAMADAPSTVKWDHIGENTATSAYPSLGEAQYRVEKVAVEEPKDDPNRLVRCKLLTGEMDGTILDIIDGGAALLVRLNDEYKNVAELHPDRVTLKNPR